MESTVEGGTQKHVMDDLVDLKSEGKHGERGKQLRSERKLGESSKRRVERDDELDGERDRQRDVKYFNKARKPRSPLRGGNMGWMSITAETNRRVLTEHSKTALQEYNERNKQGPLFEFCELVKASKGDCNGFKYYITFKAAIQSSNASSSRIFQAVVWRSSDKTVKVLYCDMKHKHGHKHRYMYAFR